jgi:hypothetical protein
MLIYRFLLAPGNDVMSAILSLLVETLSYGVVIILMVVFLLNSSVSMFSVDNSGARKSLSLNAREYKAHSKGKYFFAFLCLLFYAHEHILVFSALKLSSSMEQSIVCLLHVIRSALDSARLDDVHSMQLLSLRDDVLSLLGNSIVMDTASGRAFGARCSTEWTKHPSEAAL